MEYFWAVVVSLILVLIVYGIISSKVRNRRIRKATQEIFPQISDHIQVNKSYNVFLSHGKTLSKVKFVGISPAHDKNNPYLPFPLCQWMIVEKPDGKRAYLKPETIRYYEEAGEEK